MADKNGIYVNDDNDGIWHLVSPDGGCTEDIFVISDENYKNNYKKGQSECRKIQGIFFEKRFNFLHLRTPFQQVLSWFVSQCK